MNIPNNENTRQVQTRWYSVKSTMGFISAYSSYANLIGNKQIQFELAPLMGIKFTNLADAIRLKVWLEFEIKMEFEIIEFNSIATYKPINVPGANTKLSLAV